ncbi:MAG: endopeptidase La, partial [Clostridia bacterium]|nr:endopeptidase La [Clostridia bacterium]
PKDGPSAGITLMTALMSAITGIPVRENLAMTGEITLRGRVLKIGGLREKLLAAIRAGIATALVPEDNKSDVEEMESAIREQIKVIYVSDANSVLHHALISKPSVPQAKMHGRQNTDVVTTA